MRSPWAAPEGPQLCNMVGVQGPHPIWGICASTICRELYSFSRGRNTTWNLPPNRCLLNTNPAGDYPAKASRKPLVIPSGERKSFAFRISLGCSVLFLDSRATLFPSIKLLSHRVRILNHFSPTCPFR